MPQPEQHTIVRFKLSSLLAIMFGLSLVLAVAGPTLRSLDAEQQRRLLLAVGLLGAGAAMSVFFCVRKRYKFGLICGRLLLAIPQQNEQTKARWRWWFLFVHVPAYTFFAYMLAGTKLENPLDYIYLCILPMVYGWSIAEAGLMSWAEGYSSDLQLCENGVMIDRRFIPWSSSDLRDIHWAGSRKLIVNIRRAAVTYSVPLCQCEGVEAVLEHYYRPQREAATDLN